MNRPTINVTPLIDVLLVLLIIFMVVTPMKPSSFKTRVPSEPTKDKPGDTHPDMLAVVLNPDLSLRLNNEPGLGTSADSAKLIERLRQVFDARIANGNITSAFADDPNRPTDDRIERTVFIKAPRGADYGEVA